MDARARDYQPPKSRFRRVLRVVLRVVAVLGLVLLALPPAVLIALSFAGPRAFAARQLDRALATTFRGRLHFARIDGVDLTGARTSGSIDDPSGKTVIRFQGVHVRLNVPRLLFRVIKDGGTPSVIDIESVDVANAEVWLLDDGKGSPTLAQTFDPRTPSPPGAPSSPPPSIAIARVSVRHTWIHGRLGTGPLIDADLAAVQAKLGLDRSSFHVELERARVTSRLEPYALNPSGNVSGALRIPMGSGDLSVDGAFSGAVADAGLEAKASLTGNKLDASVLLPAVDQRTLRRFAPDLALRGTLAVSASAKGATDDLGFTLEASGEAGDVHAKGTLRGTKALRATLSLDGKRLDASAVLPTAPATRVDVDAALTMAADGDAWSGNYDVSVPHPTVAATALPSLETRGALSLAGSRVTVTGDASVNDPGARVHASYEVHLVGATGSAETTLRVDLSDPARLSRLADVRTSGTLNARGRVTWPAPAVDATLDLKLASVEHGSDRFGATTARVLVSGPVSAPRVDAALSVDSFHVLERDFRSAKATVTGGLKGAHVDVAVIGTHDEHLTARTDVRAADGRVTLEQTSVTLHDRTGTVEVAASRALLAAGDIEVERISLRGAGWADGTFALHGSELRASAKTKDLELPRLAALAGISTPLHSARATLAVDVKRGRRLDANVAGSLDHVSYASVKQGKASFDLGVRGETLSGKLDTELVPGAKLVVDFQSFVFGRLTTAKVELPEGRMNAVGKLDLTCMSPLLGAIPALPVEEVKGTIDLDVRYQRDNLETVPELAGRVRTHDLQFIGKRAPSSSIDSTGAAIAAAPSVYRGIDFGLDLGLDAASQQLTTHLGLYDDEGVLLTLDAAAGPWPSGSLAEVVAAAERIPVDVKATMPARKLAALPPPIRPLSLRGTVAGDLTFDGTFAEPHLVVDARGSRLAAASERIQGETKPRVTVLAHLDYRRDRGAIALVADRAKARAVDAKVEWTGDIVRGAQDPAALDRVALNAQAVLHELDLETIPALKNRQIEGIVSGTVRLEYSAERRLVFADIVAHPLRAGQSTLDRLNVTLDASPGAIRGAVSLSGQSGALDAALSSGLTWPPHAVPTLAGEIVAKLSARQFRLAGLWPLVSNSVNELDGKLDAELTAHVKDGNVELAGTGRLADGLVQMPSIGQRFEAISAQIKVAPAAIVIDNLKARGLTGGLSGSARIELDQHLAVREINTTVSIEKRQKLPITVEGVAMGDAWGKVAVRLVNSKDHTDLSVNVPNLHIEVPDSDRNGVQDLDADEHIRIGMRREDAVFAALPVQPLEMPNTKAKPMAISIELGSVWLKKGDLVNAEVTGKLHIDAGEKSVLTGQIDLKGGSLDVSGKRFDIERGAVTFTGGDPSNPTISAQARWDAPAGYAVIATYAGTAKKGSLTLRAEPPLTQDEIVNLILFGTPEGSVSSGGGDTATGAIGLAGGTAAKGINRAISDFTKLDIQARVDTSTGSPRPELMVPVTHSVSARVTRAIGEPTPGTSPDRTFLTLELRLKKNWALSALLGDRGASALDLVWRSHY